MRERKKMESERIVKMKVIGQGLAAAGRAIPIGSIIEVNEQEADYLDNNKPQLATKNLNAEIKATGIKEVKKMKDKELKKFGTKTKELIK
jgi:hypothetical protein